MYSASPSTNILREVKQSRTVAAGAKTASLVLALAAGHLTKSQCGVTPFFGLNRAMNGCAIAGL